MSTLSTIQLSHESVDLRDIQNDVPLEAERQSEWWPHNVQSPPSNDNSPTASSNEQLLAYRALQGVAIFNHLASFVSLVTQSIPSGRAINVAFPCLGPSQLLGFLVGLVLGGVLVDAVGWRVGFFYLTGGLSRLLSEWASSVLASPCIPLSFGFIVRRASDSLWRNTAFSSVCATMLWSFAVLESTGTILQSVVSIRRRARPTGAGIATVNLNSGSFQDVQGLSATEASTQLLPSLVVGIILNFTTVLFVHKRSPSRSGHIAFFAQLLQPISGDILFTVGLIIVPEVFPEDTQTLAGAVFNAASQFGTCLGLAIMQVVAGVVTKKAPIDALLLGYRASFWAMSGFMVLCSALGLVGLHKAGKLGNKKED
ncbi:major facilitator superfamily transporter [Colletotrichum camelliae]|nr:major facilitator superfamily transporter [Colletotrichum camelliae]